MALRACHTGSATMPDFFHTFEKFAYFIGLLNPGNPGSIPTFSVQKKAPFLSTKIGTTPLSFMQGSQLVNGSIRQLGSLNIVHPIDPIDLMDLLARH